MTFPTWRVIAGRAVRVVCHLALGAGVGMLVAPCSLTAEGLPAAAVGGQDIRPDPRWRPWFGCWEPVSEEPAEGALARPATMVCVERGEAAAEVVLRTYVDGQPPLTGTVTADGVRRPTGGSDCQGWQTVEWSSSGQRLFTGAEMTCADQAPVRLSGFATITPDDRWLDIQGVNAGRRGVVRVRSYRRARSQPPEVVTPGLPPFAGARPETPPASIGPLTVDELKEAGARLSPFLLEAAVAETNVDFALNGKRLIALADAGVPRRVIDLIVALRFPNQFVVERLRGGRPGTGAGISISRVAPATAAMCPPLVCAVHGDFYSDEWWDPTGPIVVEPGPGPGDRGSRGLAVAGHGYTQIRPRDDAPGASHASTSDDSGSNRSDTSSGATASPDGYASGASSSDSGRTAQERPPP